MAPPDRIPLEVRPSGFHVLVVACLEVARHNDLEFDFDALDTLNPRDGVISLGGPDRHQAAEQISEFCAAYGYPPSAPEV